MSVRTVFQRLSRALERFNDSFVGTAASTGVARSEGRGVNPDAVVAVIGEIEKQRQPEDGTSPKTECPYALGSASQADHGVKRGFASRRSRSRSSGLAVTDAERGEIETGVDRVVEDAAQAT